MEIYVVVNPEVAHAEYGFILGFEQGRENPNHYWKEQNLTTKSVIGVEVELSYY